MFESIRKNSKVVMLLLFLLIIPSFVLVGIDHNYFTSSSPVVARVDGQDITQDEWDNAHRFQSDNLRAQNPGIDGKLLDSPQARYAVLERLVHDRVLAAAMKKMHLMTSDARLAQELQNIPQIAALRRADGTLDAQAYRTLVGAQGLTPEGFEARIRQEMSLNQVLGSISATGFSTPAQAALAMGALHQRREIQVARFDANTFASQVQVSDADLENYYKAHPEQFQQAEKASAEYVVLNLDSIKASIQLNEDDLRTYYKENLDRLKGKEERRASHILINTSKDAPEAERTQAKARAQALLEQVRSNPDGFAELAKKESQDPGSAPSGGDLGFFGPGAMVKPFEDATFALEKGGISEVVETDFGYHIIRLTDIKAPPVPSFEALRPSLEDELKTQQAQRQFAEAADTFSNLVYEQADDLKPVAEKLGLKIETASDITSQPQADQGPLSSPRFLEALFSRESLDSKRNTKAIETAPSTLTAGRITAYQPAMLQPLEQAREQVRSAYVAQQAATLARQQGEKELAAWKAKPDSASTLGAAITVARETPQDQPSALVNAVLQAPIEPLPAWVGVDLGLQGYAIAKINRIVPREGTDEASQRRDREQYNQVWTAAEQQAYYEWLKQRFKVQIKVPRPSATSGTTEDA